MIEGSAPLYPMTTIGEAFEKRSQCLNKRVVERTDFTAAVLV